MRKLYLLPIISTILCACASTMSMDDYLAHYFDWSRAELEAVWGKPDSVLDIGEGKRQDAILQYNTSRNVPQMVSPAIYQPYYDGRTTRHRIVQPERWETVRQDCTTVFTLFDDAVNTWYYEGNGCSAAMMPALPKPKQPEEEQEGKRKEE
ncbi:MAG: hypothetical protein ACRCWR_09630 [Saezia sp.]